MVGVNSSYSTSQNDVVLVLRVSKYRRFTIYPYAVVFPYRRLHPPVHSSSYVFFTLYIPFFCLASYLLPTFVSFSDLRYAPVLLCRFLPQDVMFFLFVFQSFIGLLLKASGFLCTDLPVVQLHRSLAESSGILCTGLRKMKLYSMPLSTHILLISLWRKLIRKICVEKSMKLSGVSFPGISLEDSLRTRFVVQVSSSRCNLHRSLAESVWYSLYSFAKNETILYAFLYAYLANQFYA
ncbi:hypothetical protein LXL04_020865 [Taraxacum kok-saghyz]